VLAFIANRLASALTVILIVSTLTFGLVHLAPGGPSLLADPKLTPAEIHEIEQRLGIDRALPEQYVRWLGRVVRGDLGSSFLYQTSTVATMRSRLPATILLTATVLLVSVLTAVPLGIHAAAYPRGAVDRIVGTASFLAISTPVFWLGILLILLFAVRFHLLPAGGSMTVGGDGAWSDRLRHLVLPVIVLSAGITAELLRYTRSSAGRTLTRDWVRAVRAKGVDERSMRRRHVLRNILIPVITLVGLQLPRLIGGAAITETIFSWPGMGRLGVEAALSRDYPLIMAITLAAATAVVVTNLLVDVLYLWVDPRVRVGRAGGRSA
jgi:peptide/nickel transport system permease protein